MLISLFFAKSDTMFFAEHSLSLSTTTTEKLQLGWFPGFDKMLNKRRNISGRL
jgi:hypothetical protein